MTDRAFDQRFADVYNDLERFPSLDHVAGEMGVSQKTVRNRAGEMRSLRDNGLEVPELISRVGTGRGVTPPANDDEEEIRFHKRDLIQPIHMPARSRGTRYFILSSAQDESLVHHDFLANLKAYAAWLGDCQILISGYTYNKSIFSSDEPRPESKKKAKIHFHESVWPYLTHDQIELGDGLVFCGEMNTLPTAVTPLSGFETYTRDKWGIFPHAKIQLQAVATNKFARTKQLMTTGTVTLPNYVEKKAGIKASFHHQIGAVLVELLSDGTFFCRHLQADGLDEHQDGGFYDLDRRVANGSVTTGHRVEAISYGDIHHEKLDPTVARTTWGKGGLLDTFRPKHQFFHDLSDFSPRNHHNIKDHHFLFKTREHGVDDVEAALKGCSEFLDWTYREWCRSRVVQSNHDNALLKWLKMADFREDPANALFYLRTQTSYYEQLAAGVSAPPIFEQVLRGFSPTGLAGVEFLGEDDSYLVFDIECAMHGHLGANGSRGGPRQFARFGRKSITGHTHSPQIIDGAFVNGVSGGLDMGYNIGPSSWDHAHTMIYPNGQRVILTMMGGQWFAPRRKRSKSSREDSGCA